MRRHVGYALIVAGVLMLLVATIVLSLVKVQETRSYVVYANLGLNSVTAITVVVPDGADRPVMEISLVAEQKTTSPLTLAVASGNATIATLTADPGKQAKTKLALPGPGKYTVALTSGGLKSEGIAGILLTYRVPALYTEASAVLGPVGSLAGFLTGIGVMYVRMTAKRHSLSEEKPIGVEESEHGEKGGSIHGQGS